MKYEYGQEIWIDSNAPAKWNPEKRGWIVGFRVIDSTDLAREFDSTLGSELYTIEFDEIPSGIEIPEKYVKTDYFNK